MSSYLVANYDVTNQEGYNAYLAAVGPTIVAHNGKILVAGPNSTPVEGNPGGVTVVLEFPSREAFKGNLLKADSKYIITGWMHFPNSLNSL